MMATDTMSAFFRVAWLLVVAAFLSGTQVYAQPIFSKAFQPDIIGPGSSATLVFTIQNTDPSPATSLAFTDVLPAGVIIANGSNPTSTCAGTLTAPEGGTTITFSGGQVGGSSTCTLSVNVTSSTSGTHTNTSGDLTSSAGNSGLATADLTVATNRPGFSKTFSSTSLPSGSRSTLTFTIDNSLNTGNSFNGNFTDALPGGVAFADPAALTVDCEDALLPPTISINEDTQTLTGSGIHLPAGAAICTISVDVVATGVGPRYNVSSDYNSGSGSSGKATATLNLTQTPLSIIKEFTDDPAPQGSNATLAFTIRNANRGATATDITFTDDLDATLSGLTAAGLPMNDVCGPGSQISGTSTLTLTGGTLGEGETCTFGVTLEIPADATTGVYPDTTSAVTAMVDGTSQTGNQAIDNLFVAPVPSVTKTFLDDATAAGGTVTVEFSITNNSPDEPASDLTFFDNLTDFLGGTTANGLPTSDVCGMGSSLQQVSNFPTTGAISLLLANGTLGPGATCTFQVELNIPGGTSNGTYTNTTSTVTGTVDGEAVEGPGDSDDLNIVSAPTLSKVFTDDPVGPGDLVTLEFTLTLDESAPDAATDIAFTDDLDATLSGLEAVGLPMNDVCGPGSTLSGTSTLTLSGGTLSPNSSCTFSVTLQVPAGAPGGSFPNTTSEVTAMVSGFAVTSAPATDNLDIVTLSLDKEFTDDPVGPGQNVTLEFILTNDDPVEPATDITFTDDLDATLSGLVATGLPMNDVCGAGSQISGTSLLTFTGGTLAPGTSCTFSVTLQVPAGAAFGEYSNTTSDVTATLGGSPVIAAPATDDLFIIDLLEISITKEFTDDPVAPGDPVTLEFTIDFTGVATDATDIAFTDDLDATLSGLVATGLPMNDVCGTGSQISGTSLLTLTGGTLTPGTSCTFSVTLQVPGDAPTSTFPNTTSDVTAEVDGTPISGDPATDDLVVSGIPDVSATKVDAVFDAGGDGTLNPGDTIEYTIALTNNGGRAASSVLFDDTPDANTTLVAGSVTTTQGTVTTGNTGGDTSVVVDVGDIGNGETVTITFQAMINSPFPAGVTQVCNQGTASGSNFDDVLTGDPDATGTGDPEDTTCTPVTANPDLAITKDDGDVTVEPGGAITYTLEYANNGDQGAAGVEITDTVPEGTTFDAGASTPGWTCDPDGSAGAACTFDVGILAGGGAGGTVLFVVTVDNPLAAGLEEIENTASIDDDGANGTDPNPDDNSDSDTTPVTATPDLAITKDDGDLTAQPGDTVPYTLTYTNNGNQGATGVEIIDTVPEGTTFDAGASTPGWTCINGAPAGTVCTFAVAGEVEGGGGTGMITFTVVVDNPLAAGLEEIENTASIDDDGTNGDDPNPDDNTDSDTTPIEAAPDISATKTDALLVDQDGDGQADPGDTIGYTIEVTNDGDQEVADVVVTDTVDSLLDLDCGSLTPGQGTVISCTPGPGGSFTVDLTEIDGEPRLLARQATAQITFSATIVVPFPATADQVANQATVSYTSDTGTEEVVSDDPDTARPRDPTVTPINLTADLELTKTASTTTPNFGTQVTFTLTVTNQGPVNVVTGVEVRDVLPSGLTFVSAEGDGDYRPETGIWKLHGVAMGVPETIEITVIIDGLNPITNVAEVIRADLPDPDSTPGDGQGDDFDTVTLTPIAADLELSKRLASRVESPDGTTVTGTFALTLTNKGPSPATGVEVMEFFAGEMTFVSASPAGAFNPATSTWTVGTLAVGASTTLSITVTAPTGGTVINLAEVSAVNETDPDSTPLDGTGDDFAGAALNRGSVSFPPLAADLSIMKEVSQPQPILGEHITYTITISNAGPFTTAGVVVTDLLPEGLLFVSASASSNDEGCDPCSYDAETGEWTIGKLIDGETATLMIVVEVTAEGEITNTAKITEHHLPDPDSDISLDNPNEDDVATALISVASSKATSIVRSGGEGIPETFEMSQNYPNPFNPQTTIPFGVPQAGRVVVEVYNLLGQRVAVLMDQELAAGRHEVVWQALDQPTGMYLVRMVAGETTLTRRVTLVK